MNYILFLYVILCVIFILIQFTALYKKLFITKKGNFTVPVTPKDKARYYVGLVVSGSIAKHTIVNKSNPRNDDDKYKSYVSFFNTNTVKILKNLKGDNPFVEN